MRTAATPSGDMGGTSQAYRPTTQSGKQNISLIEHGISNYLYFEPTTEICQIAMHFMTHIT